MLQKETSEKVDTLCKKFEQLTMLTSKDKPKKNIQKLPITSPRSQVIMQVNVSWLEVQAKDAVIVEDKDTLRWHVIRSRQTSPDLSRERQD